MFRKNSASVLCFLMTFFIPFFGDADGPTITTQWVNIRFDTGMLSVDIKNIDVRQVLKSLEEKGNIKIFNKKVLPDSKISLKFIKLKIEEGIKKLMHACGVRNYATIFTKQSGTGEARIVSLILVKAEIVPEAEVEKKPEAGKAIILLLEEVDEQEEADEQISQDIIKEIMEEKVTIIDDED